METKELETTNQEVVEKESEVKETKQSKIVEIDIFKLYEKQQEMINVLNKQYLEILSKQEQNKNTNNEDEKPLKI